MGPIAAPLAAVRGKKPAAAVSRMESATPKQSAPQSQAVLPEQPSRIPVRSPQEVDEQSPARSPSSFAPLERHNTIASGAGDRLPDSVQTNFSRKFQRDLSQVSVHHDAAASHSVDRVGASAFARGSDLFVRQGAYQPYTAQGQALLAHELAHVVQQAGARSSAAGRASSSEDYARRASSDQLAGAGVLDAGPVAPLSIAADTGIAIEDEEEQASVLRSDSELADKSLDLEAAADERRKQAGVTDAATGKLDERAIQAADIARASVARKERQRKKKRGKKAPSAGPNSSPDLSHATDQEVQEQLRAVKKAEILEPDAKERKRLARAVGDLQQVKSARDAEEAVRQRALARTLGQRIEFLRLDIQDLKHSVQDRNERRRNTSSFITGPVHAYGGAWTEIEISEFAGANQFLNNATDALRDGNLRYAAELLQSSASEYVELAAKFDEYEEGIQRGGRRVIKTLEIAKAAGRAASTAFDPTDGFLYGIVQDEAEQNTEVAYGQRDSVDHLGIVKSEAVNAAVGKIAGAGSSVLGEAATPFLSQFGRFSGVAKEGVEYLAGNAITADLTDSSFVDLVTDPANLVAHGVGKTAAKAKAQAKAAGDTVQGERSGTARPRTAEERPGQRRNCGTPLKMRPYPPRRFPLPLSARRLRTPSSPKHPNQRCSPLRPAVLHPNCHPWQITATGTRLQAKASDPVETDKVTAM